MLQGIKRLVTAEAARNGHLETQLKKWLIEQLLPPAPGRPRELMLGKGTLLQRSCHINPCAVKVKGTEYVDLDVRGQQGSKVIMTIRIRADSGRYAQTLWR